MSNYDETTYGERVADVYDEWYDTYDEVIITTLGEMAQGGRALELGIGTGRIGLPLQQTGVEVHGIDASPAMVARLREKPGGKMIPVTMGNFADVAVEGTFNLIYVLFNTFFGLLEQDEQLRCFENVARHLEPEGVFVIEVFVPDLKRFDDHQTLRVIDVANDALRLDATQHDPVKQRISSQHVLLTEEGVRLYPVQLRYAWPSELDLMARLAGLRLRGRWEDWERGRFSADSGRHVSVYGIAS